MDGIFRKLSKTKSLDNVFIGLLILLSFLHLLFALRTDNYFSVDDFSVLGYVRTHSLFELIKDFLLHGDLFGFGKVTGYVLFKLLYDFFDTNAYYFNFTFFVLQTLNLLLIYQVGKKVSGKMFAPFFSAVIFNKYYLFYFSNIHEILATLFFLFTLYLFLVKKKYFTSYFAFIIALLSKEVAFITPFVLMSLQTIRKLNSWRTLKTYFIILALYIVYQVPFFDHKFRLPLVDSYKLLITPEAFVEGLNFFIPLTSLTFLILLPLFSKKYKSYLLLLFTVLALLPVLFLVNRRELYYFYLPASIISIFLSINLPKLNLKTSLVYLAALLVFGGRSVFPKIAWHTFPNWQKVSIENMVHRIEMGVALGESEIYVGDINLERDAKLVIQNNVVDLFLSENNLQGKQLNYNSEKNYIIIDN
jgi:hypothetical protein